MGRPVIVKACCVCFLLLIIWTSFPDAITAEVFSAEKNVEEESFSPEPFVEDQLDRLGHHEVEQFWQKVREDYEGFLPDDQPIALRDFFRLDGSIFSLDMLLGLLRYFFQEVLLNIRLLGTIILLTIFSMILQQIQTAFENNSVSKVAYAITYLVIFILAINSFYQAMNFTQEAIQNMVHFMIALIPLLLALMASMGSITSASLFHPVIIFLVNTSGLLIKNVVLPLLFFSTILGIVSAFSEHYKVTQLANLLRNISIGVLGVFLTIFLGVVSVQGASAAIMDGVTIKAAKFVTGNFVPIVGRMFTDATDTVIGASLLIKNTVGMAGVVILIMICAFPAIKVLAIAFIFQLSAALLQPLGNSSVIECLNVIGKNLMFVFAALATMCLMFFLALTMIIAAGNLSVMVR